MKGYGFLQIVDHKPTEFLLSLKEIVMFLRILILDFKVNFFFILKECLKKQNGKFKRTLFTGSG